MEYVFIAVVSLLAGVVVGFFVSKKYMMTYLEKNPPFNEQMLGMMMAQMGQKPSQKKLNQIMKTMNTKIAKK